MRIIQRRRRISILRAIIVSIRIRMFSRRSPAFRKLIREYRNDSTWRSTVPKNHLRHSTPRELSHVRPTNPSPTKSLIKIERQRNRSHFPNLIVHLRKRRTKGVQSIGKLARITNNWENYFSCCRYNFFTWYQFRKVFSTIKVSNRINHITITATVGKKRRHWTLLNWGKRLFSKSDFALMSESLIAYTWIRGPRRSCEYCTIMRFYTSYYLLALL